MIQLECMLENLEMVLISQTPVCSNFALQGFANFRDKGGFGKV